MVKNPLKKRHLRELRSDLGKYLVIFLLLVLSISEISGFLVAGDSLIYAYNESFEKYNVEDGNFVAARKLTERQRSAIEDFGVKVYDLLSTDRKLTNDTTIRIFSMRYEVDKACLMRGRFPERADEIAIDRMYADNNGLSIGDALTMREGETAGKTFRITGFVALSDYSTMFEDNSDMMFDASRFCVAVVSPEAFSELDSDLIDWRYAWKYGRSPVNESEENDMSEEFVKHLSSAVSLNDYVPRYQNQAIRFTGEDIGSDRAMMTIFLYIVIVVIAFVFGVTISNTIIKESTVIGTLRATGYTKGELLRHYMTMPLIVTLVACLIGNVLGYTVMKNLNAGLYYGSYSLTTYVTRWNADAFVKTTVIPIALMLVINWLILNRKLRLSPLKFLKHDLSSKTSRGAVKLNKNISFMSRFRIRIALQNKWNYLLLAFGILFANFLLLFGLMFPSVLSNYMKALPENMFCDYQYILQLPAGSVNEDNKLESMLSMLVFKKEVETDNTSAEKFTAYALHTEKVDMIKEENISVYGIKKDSKYIDIDFNGDEVWVSRAYAEKWMLNEGDTISPKEVYGDTEYDFTVGGIYPYDGGLCIFMDQDRANDIFDLGKGTFTGYFSDTEITDIDEKYIGQVVDYESLSKISRQLDISMGGMMRIVSVFAILMYMILIYLLSKTVIEKNASAISMTKIMGYSSREIGRLYVTVTSILVVVFILLSIPLEVSLMTTIFRIMIRAEMSGWIPFILSGDVFVKMIIYGLVTYAAVAVLEYRKIGKVPVEEALKNVE